jgi:hypothetical protein
MKKSQSKTFIVLFVFLLALSIVACGSQHPTIEAHESEYEQTPHIFSITELGETITAAGAFWEDWWNHRGVFSFENVGIPAWDDWEASPEQRSVMPDYLAERGQSLGLLLPTSGFESISDIRNYLSQYYTPTWIEASFDEGIPYTGIPFAEYEGTLYVDITRAGFPRPNWETATHALIEQDDNHAIVETTVLWGSWHREPYDDAYPWEVLYRFTFINGKIETVENPYGVFQDDN